MTTISERHYLAKLEVVKEIRDKTLQLQKLKNKIVQEVEASEQENKCIGEYKQEMDLLMQEKMAHVEELRQIHADINAMETVIKKAEEARGNALARAKRVHEEYRPLKLDVDRLRRDYLRLDRLPELHEEESDLITPDMFATMFVDMKPQQQAHQYKEPWRPDVMAFAAAAHHHPASTPSPFMPSHVTNPMLLPPSTSKAERPPPMPPIPGPPPTFRQQPPPMKSCLSCHQQIHRNAPICPLCKAKSRSRNPKKPKKKE